MRADFDSKANAISIALALAPAGRAEGADEVHARAIVALRGGRPVELQLLYPDLGIDEPLRAVAERYDLDAEILIAAAQAAIAVADRAITLNVGVRAVA